MNQDVVQQATQQVDRPRRPSWSELSGAALIFVGIMFVASNLVGIGRLENWWGVFILLPGIGAFVEALRVLRRALWMATGSAHLRRLDY